jgi:hypothetical protein
LRRDGSRQQDRTLLPSLASCVTRTYGSYAVMSSSESTCVLTAGISMAAGWRSRRGHAAAWELRRGETIPWRMIAAQIAPRERRDA